MEIKFKITADIPAETVKVLGITENTIFGTYYENGKIVIEKVDNEEVDVLENDEYDNEFCKVEGCKCAECEYFCSHFGKCTIED